MKKVSVFFLIVFVLAALGLAAALRAPADTDVPLEDEVPTAGPEVKNPGQALVGVPFAVPGIGIEVPLSTELTDYGRGDNFGSVIYLDEYAVAVVVDDVTYLVAPVAANTGGSGTFVYLVAYQMKNGRPVQVGEVLLGDRIKVERVTVGPDGRIEAIIYDRAEDEPFAAPPTIEYQRTFEIRDKTLLEL